MPWISSIILCSTSNRQEQIQEIISEHLNDFEGLKYLCTSNGMTPSGQAKNNNLKYEATWNKLLKYCINHLNEQNDIVIVHDPNMPCVDEEILSSICFEAFKHGAACLSTCDNNAGNLLAKLEESSIEQDEPFNSPSRMNRSLSTSSGALVSDYFDSNYRLCFKPQAFKHSIFRIIFENVKLKNHLLFYSRFIYLLFSVFK